MFIAQQLEKNFWKFLKLALALVLKPLTKVCNAVVIQFCPSLKHIEFQGLYWHCYWVVSVGNTCRPNLYLASLGEDSQLKVNCLYKLIFFALTPSNVDVKTVVATKKKLFIKMISTSYYISQNRSKLYFIFVGTILLRCKLFLKTNY